MTELSFPGGSVVIDEGRIWRALESWLAVSGRMIGNCKCTQGTWSIRLSDQPLLGKDREYTGTSQRGMLDAVAQALTVAMFPEE